MRMTSRDGDAPGVELRLSRRRLLQAGVLGGALLAIEGCVPGASGPFPVSTRYGPVGGPDVHAALALGIHLAHRAGRISDHDATIGRHLARILSGGDVRHRTVLGEQQMLDLEREAFLKLTGEPRTLERIGHTLKTGKILRN